MDEGLGYLIGGGIVIYLIYLFIVYVVPWLLAGVAVVLAGAAIVGTTIGLIIAIKNFSKAIKIIVNERKSIGNFKNAAARDTLIQDPASDFSGYIYEEQARRSYFLGASFADTLSIIKNAFICNFSDKPDFSRGLEWYSHIFFFIWALFQVIAMYGFGMIVTLALSAVLLVLSLAFMLITCVLFGIFYVIETLYFKMKRISYRCPVCKTNYNLPVYACPTCHIRHVNLKPGKFGVFRRKCLCGTTYIPLTVHIKGKKKIVNPVTQSMVWEKFKYTDLQSYCPNPNCGAEYNAKLSRPISIALIGGASAGKTTFKIAFSREFIEDELSMDVECEFLNANVEREYEIYKECFDGKRLIDATSLGNKNDILTFSFFLRHKKLGTDRMVQIYDMPGECFEQGDVKEGWEHFTFSEGAVFLIDPYSLTKVWEQNENEIKGSNMATSTMSMDRLIDSLIDTLRNVKTKKHNGKFTIPIALTINKADSLLLRKQIGEMAVQNLMSAYPDVFKDRFVAMDYACRCFLSKHEGEGFIANLDNNFENVHFFSSSPMGYVPKGVRVRFRPISVLPVMQWMMLRADKNLGDVWQPKESVVDLTDEQRNLYRTHKEYYEDAVENKISYENAS